MSCNVVVLCSTFIYIFHTFFIIVSVREKKTHNTKLPGTSFFGAGGPIKNILFSACFAFFFFFFRKNENSFVN